ncbi:MAG: hypothetical protein WC890_02315 [Candidatus Margulisiibacteriota bacterium]
MIAESIGRISAGNIPVTYLRGKNQHCLRVALVQAGFSPTAKVLDNVRKHRTITEELVKITREHGLAPDIVLFQELSTYGGMLRRNIIPSNLEETEILHAFQALSRQCQTSIGFGRIRQGQTGHHNCYTIVSPIIEEEPFNCDKALADVPSLSAGSGPAIFAKYRILIAICDDYIRLVKPNPFLQQPVSLLVRPSCTTNMGVESTWMLRFVYSEPIAVINHTGKDIYGFSAYSESSTLTHSMNHFEEEVLLVDVPKA